MAAAEPARPLLRRSSELPARAQRQTAQELVADELRQAIVGGGLPGGTRLVQSEIAAELGVSTTPVREAIRALAAEGLIQLDSYRGAVVYEPKLEDVLEVYELRLILEPLAVERAAAKLSAAGLAGLDELQSEMNNETETGRWTSLNRAFHKQLVAAAESTRLTQIVHSLQDTATAHVGLSIKAQPGQRSGGNHDHRMLIEACRERDGARAGEIIRGHLQATVDAIETMGK